MRTCDKCNKNYYEDGVTVIYDGVPNVAYYCGDCWQDAGVLGPCNNGRCCQTSDDKDSIVDQILNDMPSLEESTITAEDYERLAPLTIVAGRLE